MVGKSSGVPFGFYELMTNDPKLLSNSFNFAGTVDLRYKLGLITHKYQLTHRNLADGYPHYINITRHNRTIKSQVCALKVMLMVI